MRHPALATLLLLAACGPGPSRVAAEYKPKFDALRARFTAIATKLPAEARETGRDLNPPLDYPVNADVLMEPHLRDPAAKPEFDLLLSQRFTYAFHWVASPGTLHLSGRELAAKLDDALATRYLIAARVTEYEWPAAISETQFRGGHATLDVFVVDLQGDEIVASFRVTAAPDSTVTYRHEPGKGQELGALVSSARSTIWSNARKAVADRVVALTRGRFVIKD